VKDDRNVYYVHEYYILMYRIFAVTLLQHIIIYTIRRDGLKDKRKYNNIQYKLLLIGAVRICIYISYTPLGNKSLR